MSSDFVDQLMEAAEKEQTLVLVAYVKASKMQGDGVPLTVVHNLNHAVDEDKAIHVFSRGISDHLEEWRNK